MPKGVYARPACRERWTRKDIEASSTAALVAAYPARLALLRAAASPSASERTRYHCTMAVVDLRSELKRRGVAITVLTEAACAAR